MTARELVVLPLSFSHAEDVVKKFCNRAVLLEDGLVKLAGSVEEVLKAYHDGQDREKGSIRPIMRP